jgi:hypothetical protein
LLNAITCRADRAVANTIESIITASRQQTSADRLNVYRHAYFARLVDVLRDLFPCLRFAVGDELFDQFARGYLERHPPRSYTLSALANRLVEHLDETRPRGAAWGDFIVELARLEQAIDRIFDGPGPERQPAFVLPTDATGHVRLAFVASFELHAFAFPVSTYYTAWKANQQPNWPEPKKQYLALFRRDYIVRRLELEPVQHAILQRLSAGAHIETSLAHAFEMTDAIAGLDPAATIREWFTTWTRAGLFAGVS